MNNKRNSKKGMDVMREHDHHQMMEQTGQEHQHNHNMHMEKTDPIIYTCPMHPEILQNHPGNCPECGMNLVPMDNERDSEGWLIIWMEKYVFFRI